MAEFFTAISSTVFLIIFLTIITQQVTEPYIIVDQNRAVQVQVPARENTQYIRAYAIDNDKYISCYFQTVPNYNGKCTRAHEEQFDYYVEYLLDNGTVLAKYGPLDIKTQDYRVILPIVIR